MIACYCFCPLSSESDELLVANGDSVLGDSVEAPPGRGGDSVHWRQQAREHTDQERDLQTVRDFKYGKRQQRHHASTKQSV